MRIVDRGAKILLMGEDSETLAVQRLLGDLLKAVRQGYTPTVADIDRALAEEREISANKEEHTEVFSERPAGLHAEMRLRPRTRGQKSYLQAIRQNEITLVIGPAGTGKTYLAMAAAVSALLNKEVARIILTRPAVEAGESLGFLPGSLLEKVNPYLRPLYDALYAMVDMEKAQRFIEQERIEVAPLAYMRGRTLDHAFIILDEAQNTTEDQMLMFLTRLGQGSKAVVTGDVTQIDLPRGKASGLIKAHRILEQIEGIGLVSLTKADVVRNPLVQKIINAYESNQNLDNGNLHD